MHPPEDNNGNTRKISSLCVALDERDSITDHHCDRVSGLALELGQRLALTDQDLRCLRLAARLHDIGKIGIPDTVLKKPGRLTQDDWVVMKSHATRSERIVLASDIADAELIAAAVRHHHEQFDGSGYPDGVAGESIPVLSRIVAIADTYDAMARLRMYGQPVPHRDIMKELARVAGTQHDPYISSHFAHIIESSSFKTA
jgi:HD-GYP domain-containing protein (c-di-GMP phosphodiesterase class II)